MIDILCSIKRVFRKISKLYVNERHRKYIIIKLKNHILKRSRKILIVSDMIAAWNYPEARRVSYENWWTWKRKELSNDLFFKIIKNNFGDVRISFYKPHLVFFSVFGRRSAIKNRYRTSKKIFYTGENIQRLQRFKEFTDHCLNDVNLSIGFSHVNNIFYKRFPYWIITLLQEQVISIEVISRLIDTINLSKSTGEKFCSMIARHDESGLRGKIIFALEQVGHVACPGTKYHNDDTLFNMEQITKNNSKIEYLNKFKFTICPENSVGEGYITEKLIDAFIAGCVPIYSGYSEDPEPGIINPQAFLFWKENETNHEVIAMIEELNQNEKKRLSFLEQPKFLPGSASIIYETVKDLEGKIVEMLKK